MRSSLLLAGFTAFLFVIACSSQPSIRAVPATTPAISVPTASPSPVGTEAPPPARRGGTLRIAQATDPASCDLHSAKAMSFRAVHPCNPLLSQLIRYSAEDHSVIAPDLATDWNLSADGLEWRFNLREDVLWHDGTLFTVDDAVFSLERARKPPAGIAPGRANAIARYISDAGQIRAESGQLVIRTDFPAASFIPNLASVYVSIYPRQATMALDPPSMSRFETVIGTGPFKAGSSVRGSHYKLVRNEEYYLPGLPYLDGVEFHVIPETALRRAAFRTHQIDSIAVITERSAMALKDSLGDKITVFSTPSAGGNTVQMNLSRAPFDDPRVRRAVNLAISRESAELALGEGLPGAILPPGGQFAFPPDRIESLPGSGDSAANRQLARELLAEAGFPDGFSTTIHTQSNSFFSLLTQFIAGQLAEIGIVARVEELEPVMYQQRITNGDFSMIGHSHSFALDDPDSILPSHYSCGGAENFPGLCDPVLDNMIWQQSRELDPDKRKELLIEIERMIWEKDAKVWFQWSIRRTPVWNNVVGLRPGGPSLYQGRRLDEVYMRPES